MLSFDAPAPVLHEITRVLAITDDVLRFMATNRIPGSSPARPDAARRGTGGGARRGRLTPSATPPIITEHTFGNGGTGGTMANINRVILTGNLTADPELSSLPSGT